MAQVDSIEQHRELSGVELGPERAFVEGWQLEATLLQAFVGEDKAAVVPGEYFYAVSPARKEDEEMAHVQVFLPLRADQRAEPVDAFA